MTGVPPPPEGASLREVYSLVGALRTEVLAELKSLAATVDTRFTQHDAEHSMHQSEHEKHEQQHLRDRDHRASMIRWAVTSILSGLGVLIALYVAIGVHR